MFNPRAIEGPGMTSYRAPSLFQPHRVRQAIRDAHDGKIKPMMGLYLGLSSIPLARFMAPMGFDFVWIDWEHSVCGTETMSEMVHNIQFMSEGRSVPFVRVPGHDHAAIGFALDAGANIVIPQVETVEQCKHVVSAAKFGTHQNGTRSAPPFRLIGGLTDIPCDPSRTIWKNVNDQAAIMIQIETLKGIENLDAILTECPEVDIVWFGTLDCRISMNLEFDKMMPSMDPEWVDAAKLYADTLVKHNKPSAGFALGPPEVAKAMGEGMSMIVVAADVLGLVGQSDTLAGARELFGPLRPAKTVIRQNGQNGQH